jgi:predicted lipoprotein with Yx(FWY)xxD motif
MKRTTMALGLLTLALAAGCSGGGSGGASASNPYFPPPGPSPAPTPAPTNNPSSVLATHNINGGAAFVDSSNHAVYTFDGDTTANQSNCTCGCAAVWPAVAPPRSNLPRPWAEFRRGDGSLQLSYKGKPLYTFVNDTQPFVATGDGVDGFHVARP